MTAAAMWTPGQEARNPSHGSPHCAAASEAFPSLRATKLSDTVCLLCLLVIRGVQGSAVHGVTESSQTGANASQDRVAL